MWPEKKFLNNDILQSSLFECFVLKKTYLRKNTNVAGEPFKKNVFKDKDKSFVEVKTQCLEPED